MPSAPDRVQFVADRGDGRRRLDQTIQRRLRQEFPLSRNRVQVWIDQGRVLVDGAAARRASARTPEGALVEILLGDDVRRRERPQPEHGPLDVMYQDDALLVLNKPAGVVVHPSYRNNAGTLLNSVMGHLGAERGALPGIITLASPLTGLDLNLVQVYLSRSSLIGEITNRSHIVKDIQRHAYTKPVLHLVANRGYNPFIYEQNDGDEFEQESLRDVPRRKRNRPAE